jgi:hypothetical protein
MVLPEMCQSGSLITVRKGEFYLRTDYQFFIMCNISGTETLQNIPFPFFVLVYILFLQRFRIHVFARKRRKRYTVAIDNDANTVSPAMQGGEICKLM